MIHSKLFQTIEDCRNTGDFRTLAKAKLLGPVFHYIDGAADDEVTYRRNTTAYDQCDLIPNVLAGVEDIDMSVDIMVSNHGGRQLDGCISPFDQLADIVDAVGDRVDVICDGGIRRGTHVLKALSVGAKACSGGRWYFYALAAGGQAGMEKAIRPLDSQGNANMKAKIERDMKLMGVTDLAQISRRNIKFRS